MWLFGVLSAMVLAYVAYCWRGYYLTPDLVIAQSVPSAASPALHDYYRASDLSDPPPMRLPQMWDLLVHPYGEPIHATAQLNKRGVIVLHVPWQSKSVLLPREGEWKTGSSHRMPGL